MSVKLYFNQEIRRFPLPTNPAPNVAWLNAKIGALFDAASFDARRVKIFWRDSEKDLITVRNDDDLNEALRNRTDDVLRLYLEYKDEKTKSQATTTTTTTIAGGSGKISQGTAVHTVARAPIVFLPPVTVAAAPQGAPLAPAQPMEFAETPKPFILEQQQRQQKEKSPPKQSGGDASESDPAVHKHILCDGCDGAIKGRRYKCVLCRDYDLCEECESKHKHDQHPMLRLSSPGQKPFLALQNMLASVPIFSGSNDYLAKLGDTITEVLKHCGVDVDYEIRPPKNDETAAPREENKSGEPTAPAAAQPQEQPEQRQSADNVEPKNVEIIDHSPASQAVNQDWEILDRATTTLTANTAAASSGGNLYPEMVTMSDFDARVEDALARMQAMGFGNEGDWLRNMLKSKNADIPSVLDALQPTTLSHKN